MMPTPSEIQTCISNLTTSSQSLDFTLLAAEASNANVGLSFTVATVNDLPDLANVSIGVGQIVFVESIGVPVVSTENEWKGLDGRLLRRDCAKTTLYLWGNNGVIQLGIGSTAVTIATPTRELCSATNWSTVSAGCRYTLATKTDGQLWAWGCSTTCGYLGDGTTTSRCSPVREFCSATDWCGVSAGNRHATAVKTSGQIWAWGYNSCGGLGNGTLTPRCSPVREFCSATDWCQVSVGTLNTSAVKTSGQLWSWGGNTCGKLGDGTVTSRCSPVREFCSATDWCTVAARAEHTAAVKTSGQIWGWGQNLAGALGDGTTTNRCSPVREFCSATDWCQLSVGNARTVAIKTDGQLWSWGGNFCGQLGDGTTVNKCSPVREFCSATDWCGVSTSAYHTAAIKTTGQLWAWGYNNQGRLGDGTVTPRCSPVREITSATDWCRVSAGYNHTAAITSTL